MTGGLMQLIAHGEQDTYLSGNPQITFFKIVYRRHTNFSMETIRQTLNGDTITDTLSENRCSVIISRNGDLLSKVYVTSSTVGITDGSEIIKEVSIDIGGQEIDKQTKEWFQIWNELTIPEDKRLGFKNMIGCLNNNYNSTGTIGVNHIQIPLQFWFCRNPGLALPLIALQYHEVQLNFVFGSDVGVNAELSVECDYFYLDTDERRRFSQVSHEYLIEQLQVQQLNNVSDHKISFNHPVKELIWTSTTDYGDASLSLNGLERFEKQKKEYFQLRQPYDYHSAIPGYNIPITEKTELLTIPIDTGIKQHNFFPGDGVGNGYQNVISAGSIVHLENDQITFGNNVEALPNSEKFKIGDMISIVISAYQNPVARPKENGIEDNVGGITDPGGVVVDGADGTTENSITTSKSSYHTVSAIVDTTSSDPAVAGTKIVSFTPSINQHPGASLDNRLINNLSAADDLGDHLNVFILGRIQQKEARCSKLAKNINVYSFSLRPEDHQPSGSCNFSRIDTARLITSENLSSDDHIYAVNYNVLRIMSGMGGVAYSN
jgi:hypothetical protein|tara:strand:+ start:53 stop:1693 length:1641 start_codon:yes stop_codon:yes gene_type:complete